MRPFYEALGFSPWFRGKDYEIVSRGHLVVHFEEWPGMIPQENRFSCYLRVKDADQLYREFAAMGLPVEGTPRLTPPQDEPWGMREFTLKDPAGICFVSATTSLATPRTILEPISRLLKSKATAKATAKAVPRQAFIKRRRWQGMAAAAIRPINRPAFIAFAVALRRRLAAREDQWPGAAFSFSFARASICRDG